MASLIDLDRHAREFGPRGRVLLVLYVLSLAVLVGRFWFLQVVKGEYYFEYAARNSFKAREVPAPRGIILDAHGNRIADVRPSFDIVIRPDRIRKAPTGKEHVAPRPGEPVDIRYIAMGLSRYLQLPVETILEKYQSARGRARYNSVVIKGDVSRDEIAMIEAHRIELPGVDIQVSQKRTYPYGELFSHVVGYLGEVQREELARLRDKYRDTKGEDYYEIGDFLGKYGIEKQYESFLKGQDGSFYVLEDAAGRVVDSQADRPEDDAFVKSMLAHLTDRARPAVPGMDLTLTIDLDLQRYIRDLMADQVGSVIAMEPSTGRILAMFNNPSFDPEIFARGISQTEWDALRNDEGHPLEDKALRGQYPPGSTFKMIPAAAFIAEKVATPSSMVYCPGYMKIGGRRFRCHKSSGHGLVDLHRAIVYSCDVYFYALSSRLGIDRLARYAREFGMGSRTGLGLNQEKPGLIPGEPWKLKVFKQPWVVGDTVSAAIGQGYVLATPIQLARYTAAIANGGRLMKPYLVERVQTVDGQIVEESQPQEVGHVTVSDSILKLIRNGMLGVVEDPAGTARKSRLTGITMAGKTGTAQVVRQDTKDAAKRLKAHHQDHALFTAYAPFDNPEIVVTVLIEHGGHGGSAAAPIARDVMKRFFQNSGRLPLPETEKVAGMNATVPAETSELLTSEEAMVLEE